VRCWIVSRAQRAASTQSVEQTSAIASSDRDRKVTRLRLPHTLRRSQVGRYRTIWLTNYQSTDHIKHLDIFLLIEGLFDACQHAQRHRLIPVADGRHRITLNDCRRMSVCEPGLRSSRLMLQVGKFCVLQICYSNGGNPYLTGLAPVIPPPELGGGKGSKIVGDGRASDCEETRVSAFAALHLATSWD